MNINKTENWKVLFWELGFGSNGNKKRDRTENSKMKILY
jgi:hypothetical protein